MFQTSAMPARWTSVALALLGTAVGLTFFEPPTRAQQPAGRRIDDPARSAGASGDAWTAYGLDPGEKRYSPLTQIDATNVTRLGQVWAFDIPGGNTTPPGGGNQEATLLASN